MGSREKSFEGRKNGLLCVCVDVIQAKERMFAFALWIDGAKETR